MKLPIGISTFEKIRSDGHLYIDKTEFALRLIQEHEYVFLSRPRRFGKSLFLDTLKEIFEGNRELFTGLYIYDKYDFEQYPVIKISFGGVRGVKGFYASVFYGCIASLGLRIIPEDVTSRGKIDFTVFINDVIYIFEFKVTVEEPLKQIKEMRYYEKYVDSGKKIILVGINFDENERNISRMEWEDIC